MVARTVHFSGHHYVPRLKPGFLSSISREALELSGATGYVRFWRKADMGLAGVE
jgi:hypothetical protein